MRTEQPSVRNMYEHEKHNQIVAVGNAPVTAFYVHKKHWDACYACALGATAQCKVLFRGHIPCDILFVGNQPDRADDTLGRPFTGESAEAFDEMMIQLLDYCAVHECYPDWCLTTAVACTPYMQPDGPTKEEVKACAPRLKSFIEICEPKLVVSMGDIAKRSLISIDAPGSSRVTRSIHAPEWMMKQKLPELEIRKAALLLGPILVRLMEQTDASSSTR